MSYDVIIIGGGVVGCAVARELSRSRAEVLLIDKECEVGFGTSKANSGIIHAGHHSDPATVKGRLEWRGNQAWDDLADDLGFGFDRIGELTVAFDEDDLRTLDELEQQGRAKGVTGLRRWDAERVRREEPALSHDIIGALHAPSAGVVNPYEACFSLAENAVQNGVRLVLGQAVLGIERRDDGFDVRTERSTYACRYVVNAAGLFADEIAKMVGIDDLEIRARKGEEYLLDKRLRGYVTRLIFPSPTPTSKGVLVIPTYDGTLMVGPTSHWSEKDDLSTSAEGAAEVFEKVRRLAPGISERDCIAEFAGLRAVATGEDFILGASAVPGFIQAAGIQSPGLTAAPALAEEVVAELVAQGLTLALDPDFEPRIPAPTRFAEADPERQVQLAQRDPRFARMVCRCEWVTEGEIVEAIERGARTLDGLKFRTRAGMGRCQGGFCSWGCMELLEELADVPIEDVTKRGGDSWVVLPREGGVA